MTPYFTDSYGNPSSAYTFGREMRTVVGKAREQAAELIGAAHADEIVFTSGGTESDNWAIRGALVADPEKRHIVTTRVEHEAVRKLCEKLETEGYEVTWLGVNEEGLLDLEELRVALRPDTAVVSIMMANNETGVLQAVEEIGRVAAEADVYFHTDAVQAAGKVAIDVKRIGCDLLSISGHKMHAPQGVGALYVRKGTLLHPLFYGGSHERSRRAGTENVPGIVALGKAAELAQQGFGRGDLEGISGLRDRLEQTILREVEATGVNGKDAPRVPNTTSIYFDYIEGEALVIALDLKGLAVSTGAACSSGAIEPSHVLTAMGLSPERARGSLRFSLGKQTTAEDIEFALDLIPQTVARLRELSPIYNRAAVGN